MGKTLLVLLSLGGAIAVQQAHASEPLSVSGVQFQPDPAAPGLGHLIGIAHNDTDNLMPTAVVEFNLYNAQDVMVGNTLAIGQNLAANGTWQFDAPTTKPFAKWRISRINGVAQ
jgi:hypothetical protein